MAHGRTFEAPLGILFTKSHLTSAMADRHDPILYSLWSRARVDGGERISLRYHNGWRHNANQDWSIDIKEKTIPEWIPSFSEL
jgi:hypothetical protein